MALLKRYAIITLGSIIYAFGFCACCEPNQLNAGGFAGIAQIINAYFPFLPVGITTFALNLPLFIIGLRKLGWKTLTGSLYTIAISSLIIDGINRFFTFPAVDPILACIYGGVLWGIGFGILMRQGATTGGTELAAQLLKLRMESLPIGRICLIIDCIVVTTYTLTFHEITLALYSGTMLYLLSVVMDKVVYGTAEEKMAYIISSHYQEITEKLLEMNRGVTLLPGIGAYSRQDTEVILCAFNRRFGTALKRMVKDLDPHAFIIVCDAHEILGKGFTSNAR